MEEARQQDADEDGDDLDDESETENRGEMETNAANPGRTSQFSVDDKHILLGRGKGVSSHPGNQRMHRIIDSYRALYHASERGEKCVLVRKVYHELISGGAKFMKRREGTEDGWEEVSLKVAVDKVGHSLRCAKYRPPESEIMMKMSAKGQSNKPKRAKALSKQTDAKPKAVALPAPHVASSQVQQERHIGPQHMAGITSPVTRGLMLPFAGPGISVPSFLPTNPLSSWDAYLIEMERNRLRSMLSLAPGGFPASATLNGASSAIPLLAALEREQLIRQSLLAYQQPSSEADDLLSRYLGHSGSS